MRREKYNIVLSQCVYTVNLYFVSEASEWGLALLTMPHHYTKRELAHMITGVPFGTGVTMESHCCSLTMSLREYEWS